MIKMAATVNFIYNNYYVSLHMSDFLHTKPENFVPFLENILQQLHVIYFGGRKGPYQLVDLHCFCFSFVMVWVR